MDPLWSGRHYLLRHWRVCLVTILTLGFGVGTSATMFGLVDAYLYRGPSGIQAPDRLVSIPDVSRFDDYMTLQSVLRSLDVAAYRRSNSSLGGGFDSRGIVVECVTSNYFDVLGVALPKGRGLTGGPAGMDAEAVVADGLWKRQFSADDFRAPTVLVHSRRFAIVGIAPSGFTGVLTDSPDVWLRLDAAPDVCTSHGSLSAGGASVRVVARIRDGVSFSQADAEVRAVLGQLPEITRDGRSPQTSALQSIQQARLPLIRSDVRMAGWATAAAICLLLIACGNVAAILALRAIERRQEMAVRRQLGATSADLVRLVIAEHAPVAVLCCVAGVICAMWIGWLIRAFVPFTQQSAMLDSRMLVLLSCISILVVFITGVVPAVRARRIPPARELAGYESAVVRRSRAAAFLLVLQSALSFALVVGAALMVQSVQNVRNRAGYSFDHLLSISVDASHTGYQTDSEIEALLSRLRDRVQRVPGVEHVSISSADLLRAHGAALMAGVTRDRRGGGATMAMLNGVDSDYFSAVGTRVIRGRAIKAADTLAAEPVALVDETLARAVWPSEDPLGKCAFFLAETVCARVVGVSEARRQMFFTETTPEVFIPQTQVQRYRFALTPRVLFVRTASEVDALRSSLATAVHEVSPDPLGLMVQAVGAIAASQSRTWDLGLRLFGLVGVGAIVMGTLGLYWALSFSVRGRVREIGLRMALGASRGMIVLGILASSLRAVAVGLFVGVAVVALAARAAKVIVFGVAPMDPMTLLVSGIVLTVSAAAGALVPAFRAARIDPATALRES